MNYDKSLLHFSSWFLALKKTIQQRVAKSNFDVALRVTNSKSFIEVLFSSYKFDFVKYWISPRVSNSKSKNKMFHFELLNEVEN